MSINPLLADAQQTAVAQRALQPAGGGTLPYWVVFYERDAPSKRTHARLGDTPPTPGTSGGGGTTGDWSVIALPKRSAVSAWLGRTGLMLMAVPIVVGHADGTPLHVAASDLEKMYRPADDTDQPPVVKIRSAGTAVPYQNLDYVVADLAWGDMTGNPGGSRVMQKLTVTLLEYRADEVLQQQKAKAPKHRDRSYTVKAGDTLTLIAKRFNVKGGWKAIGNLQHPPIRDPRSIHTGQRLLIP